MSYGRPWHAYFLVAHLLAYIRLFKLCASLLRSLLFFVVKNLYMWVAELAAAARQSAQEKKKSKIAHRRTNWSIYWHTRYLGIL